MNIIKKKFAYLFAMGVFVLGISSSLLLQVQTLSYIKENI